MAPIIPEFREGRLGLGHEGMCWACVALKNRPLTACITLSRPGLTAAAEAPAFEAKVHTDVDIHRHVPHEQQVTWVENHRPDDPTWPGVLQLEQGPHVPVNYDAWCSKDAVQALFAAKVRQAVTPRCHCPWPYN